MSTEIEPKPHVALNNARNLPRYKPPFEKEMRQSTKCECGNPKLPGRPTCDTCWDAAPKALRRFLALGTDRKTRRQATVQLLWFAHRRRGYGL